MADRFSFSTETAGVLGATPMVVQICPTATDSRGDNRSTAHAHDQCLLIDVRDAIRRGNAQSALHVDVPAGRHDVHIWSGNPFAAYSYHNVRGGGAFTFANDSGVSASGPDPTISRRTLPDTLSVWGGQRTAAPYFAAATLLCPLTPGTD